MPEASLAFGSLMAFSLLFGLKHGFDADHLASIDGLARLHVQRGEGRLARSAGLLFSLGHGGTVLAAAWIFEWLGAGSLPDWLDPLGAWISMLFLGAIGITNLRNALRPAGRAPAMSPLARSVMHLPLPPGIWGALSVGAVFALSLDALSLAAWFGMAGGRHGGLTSTLALAVCFVIGMVLTDSINGLVVASLIRRSERFVERAGRMFSLLVAGSALLVAGFGASRQASGFIDGWADGKELLFGLSVLGIILCGYALARRMHQSAARAMPEC